ncbi:hypothetical protein [Frankia sp. EI5c]|uniref:hypothetical protein n=1 Tax=Frankia sp. EI5c TaxID=683316 RepID=UPI000A0401C0|nr:hypothetical protein [Frankia sp. EI5c]
MTPGVIAPQLRARQRRVPRVRVDHAWVRRLVRFAVARRPVATIAGVAARPVFDAGHGARL